MEYLHIPILFNFQRKLCKNDLLFFYAPFSAAFRSFSQKNPPVLRKAVENIPVFSPILSGLRHEEGFVYFSHHYLLSIHFHQPNAHGQMIVTAHWQASEQ